MNVRDLDFNKAPFLLIWEVTRACALACRHCRASAIDKRDPRELTTDQGKALMRDIASMGTPIVIFTGGDPLQREDLDELVAYGKDLGLKVGTIPAATQRLTRDRLAALRDAGLDQVAFSLDASTPSGHDDLRQVQGTFAKIMEAVTWARQLGLPVQINSVLGQWNYDDFDALASLVAGLGVVFWEVFFLVPTGRGSELKPCTADQCEDLLGRLLSLSRTAPYLIKITEAPHYRRLVAMASQDVVGKSFDVGSTPAGGHGRMGSRVGLSPLPVNSGKGFCFVDHAGSILPSGFLPVEVGNVRSTPVSVAYRTSPVFMELRDETLLKGRCGRCEYKLVCGGSRSRAYAVYGDFLAEDPCCGYEPPAR